MGSSITTEKTRNKCPGKHKSQEFKLRTGETVRSDAFLLMFKVRFMRTLQGPCNKLECIWFHLKRLISRKKLQPSYSSTTTQELLLKMNNSGPKSQVSGRGLVEED